WHEWDRLMFRRQRGQSLWRVSRRAEVNHVGRIRAGDGDVGTAVAIQIADGEAVRRSLRVAERRRGEVAAGAVVEIHDRLCLDGGDDDVVDAVLAALAA